MISAIHMPPDVYEQWCAMSKESQDFALDAIDKAILEAMEIMERRVEAEYAARKGAALSSDEPSSQPLQK